MNIISKERKIGMKIWCEKGVWLFNFGFFIDDFYVNHKH